jgi:hypothetical protein
MTYRDPQRGRDAVQAWRKANPERVKHQRKIALIERAIRERRLPRLQSIEKHGLSDEDVLRIVSAVMAGSTETVALRVGIAVVGQGISV